MSNSGTKTDSTCICRVKWQGVLKVKRSKTRPWCVYLLGIQHIYSCLSTVSAGHTPNILMSVYCVCWAYTKYTHVCLLCLLGIHQIYSCLSAVSVGHTPNILMPVCCVCWAYTKYTHVCLLCLLGINQIFSCLSTVSVEHTPNIFMS